MAWALVEGSFQHHVGAVTLNNIQQLGTTRPEPAERRAVRVVVDNMPGDNDSAMSQTIPITKAPEAAGSSEHDLFIPGGPVGFLLIPGLGGTPAEMRFLAQGLARAGNTVLCPMLAGHGSSEEELTATTWQDWYTSVEAAHDRLKTHCDVVLVGGLSAGAILALHLAEQRPSEIDGMTLFSPTLWPNGWAIPWYFEFYKLVRHRWLASWFRFMEVEPYGIKDERVKAFVLNSLQSDDRSLEDIFGRSGVTVLEFRRMVDVVKRGLGNIKTPTLIFHPRQDDQSDIRNTMLLQRRLGGLVDTVVLDDSYHIVTLDRQRDLVVARTNAYAAWLAERLATERPVAHTLNRRAAE